MVLPLKANQTTERAGHGITKVKQQVRLVKAPLRIFAGRWRFVAVPISVTPMRAIRLCLLAAAGLASPVLARGSVVYAGGAWAAIDRGATCEAVSRSQRIATGGKVQALAGVTFTPDHRRWGEFYAQLSRLPRGDASVMLRIGDQPFLLAARDGWAWSRGPLQAQAIIAAMRNATAMRIESRDSSGRRFADPYLLDGVPTAIDAAAARCALRGAGKIR
jgi:hypothetical protein